MKRKLAFSALLLTGVLSLVSCVNDGSGVSSTIVNPNDPINPIIQKLRTSYKLEGKLKVTNSYFQDAMYQIPDSELQTKVTDYQIDFTYENVPDYIGVDRRYYRVDTVGEDEKLTYLMGENSFNQDGYAALRFLDYDNVVRTSLAYDSTGGLIPYGANGLINPFLMLQRGDFYYVDNAYHLDSLKSSLLFSNLFVLLDEYQQNVTFSSTTFTFSNDKVTAKMVSNPLDSSMQETVPTPTNPYHTTFVRYQYEVDLTFTGLGISSAKDLIAPLPEREENAPLKNALEAMATATEYAYMRRTHPLIDGVYDAEAGDMANNIYFMGIDNVGGSNYFQIYSQVYDIPEDADFKESLPYLPSTSDFVMRGSTNSSKMGVYVYDEGLQGFTADTGSYSGISNRYSYNDLFLSFEGISSDIFVKNENGSYSPTNDNLPYIVRDLFMPSLDSYRQLDDGYVTKVEIYLNEYETFIDHIDIDYEGTGGYSGWVQIMYDQVGNAGPSFPIDYV